MTHLVYFVSDTPRATVAGLRTVEDVARGLRTVEDVVRDLRAIFARSPEGARELRSTERYYRHVWTVRLERVS